MFELRAVRKFHDVHLPRPPSPPPLTRYTHNTLSEPFGLPQGAYGALGKSVNFPQKPVAKINGNG